MTFSSSEILSLLAKNGSHIVRERAGSRFAEDAWVIKSASGQDLEVDLGGFAYHPVRVAQTQLDDFARAHLVQQDGDATWRLDETRLATAA